uniref:Meckelin n=2 Tax=Panagrolaimus sp. PS1159 TaxID=55785 RepID=A0AC35GPG2_9BILA
MYILFIILIFSYSINAQQNTPSIPYRSISSCNGNQYFNSITLTCINCPVGQIPNSKHDACKCQIGSRTTGWSAGSLQCAPCTGGLAVSQDGWNCVSCKSSRNATLRPDNTTGHCPPCEKNQIVEIGDNSGNDQALTEKCVNCPEGTQSNKDKGRCEPCISAECYCDANPNVCSPPTSNNSNFGIINLENGESFRSKYIIENLRFAESQCQSGESKECQHLANMCVLQNFDQSPDGACALLRSIQSTLNGQLIAPPLFMDFLELSRENAIEATFNVEPGSPNTYLDIVSLMYYLNGTFVGIDEVNQGVIQLCPTDKTAKDGTYLFGREYKQECILRLSDVIESISMRRKYTLGEQETIFHELYLRYIDNNNQQMMYPIPVINENIKESNQYVNRLENDNRWRLTRRFFLMDNQPEATINGKGVLTRVPSRVIFHIQIQPSRDGKILPPYLRLRHAEFHAIGNETLINVNEKTLTSTFQIQYAIDSRRHDKTIEILMAVFCSTSILWGALRAYAWGRRAGKQIIDSSTIIKLVLYMAEIISNIFLLVIGCMAAWITFAYKLQHHYMYVLLTEDQESSFIVYVCIALGLRLIALLHLYATLILTETFFIDWERPRTLETEQLHLPQPSSDVILAVENKSVKPPVIWRTYFVANEWNELQNYRKTSVSCQLILILLILEYLNFKDFAIVQPGFARGNQPKEFAETRLSRFAVNLTFYLIIGLIQWIFHVLIIEKFIDPFRNFMDLCSVANISVMSLTHPLRGYYIHGRSVHGLADTGMQEMNEFLKRERDNLCALRGLESNSELQTFVMNLPTQFRERYEQITGPLRSPAQVVNVRLTGGDRHTSKIESTSKVYEELNEFLKDIVDHAIPEVDYVITEPKLVEEILGLELNDTSKVGNFTR